MKQSISMVNLLMLHYPNRCNRVYHH